MTSAASYSEIVEYLKTVPSASQSWAHGLYSAGLSLAAVGRLMATMAQDVASPLRLAEEGALSKEIVKLNQAMGLSDGGAAVPGKLTVKVAGVLSAGEQVRVVKLTNRYAQPRFEPTGRFGRNGHAVMNAVRRIQAAYLTNRIPKGARVVEVGPDVADWLLRGNFNEHLARPGDYAGVRPVLSPRDSVRVSWQKLVALIERSKGTFFSDAVKERARILKESYAEVFPNAVIQDGAALGEYIVSYDANYDIAFSDMPVSMGAAGARAWYGCLVRAKGLTPSTRLTSGKLDLMGVNYRVDWAAGRIDFRHPQCSTFGYSHAVAEYMKYEQYNGYVWTTPDCHYVYSKGPETNDEILFFSVVRVPKLARMYEPRYVEDPHAGEYQLTSIWAVGDEVSGMPTAFQKVVFHVDALNFSKVLEKRRALDSRGNLQDTLILVRSTNVRMWLHGTPVSTNRRIEAKLAEATAVVVEALVAEQRLRTNDIFDEAMFVYDINSVKAGWLRRLVENFVDLKALSGNVVGSIMRVWEDLRGSIIDRALSSLSEVSVGISVVSDHLRLHQECSSGVDGVHNAMFVSNCKCAEIAEVAAAIEVAGERDKAVLLRYYNSKLRRGRCQYCEPSFESVSEWADAAMGSDAAVGGDGKQASGQDGDIPSDSGISDCGSDQVFETKRPVTWREEAASCRPEAKSMREFSELETYLAQAQLVECRVDATRILARGPISDTLMRDFSTTRTHHCFLEFHSGRCVRTYGAELGVVSAIYSVKDDVILPVRSEGSVMFCNVADGYYYTNNRLSVWNGLDLVAAVGYAQDFGFVYDVRKRYVVRLGVPGAGKTFGMMKSLQEQYGDGVAVPYDFVVLAVTKASVAAAIGYGIKFGMNEQALVGRVMTLDSYLMNKKFFAKLMCVDEFPMVHIGKVDAAAIVSGAQEVRLFGDARQIPYDPFCAEFAVNHGTLRGTIPVDKVTFEPCTHRLSADVCAMWLDQYPAIYPCDCCRKGERDRPTMEIVRVNSLDSYVCDSDVRYHTYKQDEKEDLRVALKMRGTLQELRQRESGGLATVHEDQGSTHSKVMTFRLSADFDKNASSRNPSLYNRERYVLTDTTRHTKSYTYVTLCSEVDMICKRVALSQDSHRRKLVAERKGLGNVVVYDML